MARVVLSMCAFGASVYAADPIISVGLSSGASPNAALAGEISTLNARRQAVEGSAVAKIQEAMNTALASAKAEIAQAIGGKSFMKNSVLVKVLSGPGISHANLQRIADLEGVRSNYEGAEVAQAAHEFDALTKIVVGELRSALHGASFLKSDVLVKAGSVPFPSVMGLLKNMEFARDGGEQALRSKILDLQLAFVQQLNGMIASGLHHSFLGDVATFARNPAPYDVVNIALESAAPDTGDVRKDAEEQRFEARTASEIADARAAAGAGLAKLTALEKAHASAMADIL
jgi:hypothetical protein